MIPEKELGLEALKRSDYASAIAHLEQASREAPDDFALLLYLGGAYHETKRDSEAVAVLERAVSLQPENAHAHYNLGISLDRVQKTDDAIAALERALDLQPDYPLAASVLQKWQREHGLVSEGLNDSLSTPVSQQATPASLSASPAYAKTRPLHPSEIRDRADTTADEDASRADDSAIAPRTGGTASGALSPAQNMPVAPRQYRDPTPRPAPGSHAHLSEMDNRKVEGFEPIVCEEAITALQLSIISLFGVGLIFGPAAIAKAVEARRWIHASSYLTGMREATTALLLGTLGILISLTGLAFYWWYFTK